MFDLFILTRMQSTLRSDLLNTFVRALEQLTHPEHVFKDWCKDRMSEILAQPSPSQTNILEAFEELKAALLNPRFVFFFRSTVIVKTSGGNVTATVFQLRIRL